MTYSIVARDPQTKQMGIAVQTCNLAVGTWVPWAKPGIGAVATQALAKREYGTKGLALMAQGKAARQVLDELLATDAKREFRQVGMIDSRGVIASHTGARCFPEAGSYVGDSFVAQANMMERDTVWHAMAEAYRGAEGDFADRLLAALFAAEAEGGDLRGKQTAALLVVSGDQAAFPLVDLRVDYSREPVVELRRLYSLHKAYASEYAASDYSEKGDLEASLKSLQTIEREAPHEAYLQYLRALHLAGWHGRVDKALEILKSLVEQSPVWLEYLRREASIDNFGIDGLGSRLVRLLEEKESDAKRAK